MRRLRASKIRSRVLLHVPVIVLYFSIAPRYTVGKPISAALMCLLYINIAYHHYYHVANKLY